jgi:hypothetical protein
MISEVYALVSKRYLSPVEEPMTPDGFGMQIRFHHRPHRLKLLWDHSLRAILLQGVAGNRNGPILATFNVTDSRADVAAKMRAGLAAA